MVVVPLSQPANDSADAPRNSRADSVSLVRIAAAGSLTAGGVLLVTGKRRAGLVAAASGTALAMLDQQETVRAWWNALPGYIAELQEMLARVQRALDSFTAQREKLHKTLNK
jgi:hypothetical protein